MHNDPLSFVCELLNIPNTKPTDYTITTNTEKRSIVLVVGNHYEFFNDMPEMLKLKELAHLVALEYPKSIMVLRKLTKELHASDYTLTVAGKATFLDLTESQDANGN